MARSTRLVILMKNIYTLWGRKRILLPVTYFPTILVYPFTPRVTGIVSGLAFGPLTPAFAWRWNGQAIPTASLDPGVMNGQFSSSSTEQSFSLCEACSVDSGLSRTIKRLPLLVLHPPTNYMIGLLVFYTTPSVNLGFGLTTKGFL